MRNLIQKAVIFGLIAFIVCASAYSITSSGPNKEDNRKIAVEARNDNFNKAEGLSLILVQGTIRCVSSLSFYGAGELNQPSLVCLYPGDNGNVVGYYVAKFAGELLQLPVVY